MKSGDILLAKRRAYHLLFALLVMELHENRYELLGRIVLERSN